MTVAKQPLLITRTVADLRTELAPWKSIGQSIGLVPTMGALHDGHFALIDAAKNKCDRVAATLFVNPTQFSPHEDFAAYPRNEATDIFSLTEHGVDLLYAPSTEDMYGPEHSTTIDVGAIGDDLCGEFRPGFFKGVATIVTKLLIQALPTRAYFGEKDYQQLQIIRRLAADLNIPVEICGVPTVREPDGLALSSRNAYLSAAERTIAPALYRIICEMAHRAQQAGTTIGEIEGWGKEQLIDAGFDKIDYAEIRHAGSLQRLTEADGQMRVLAAAWLGRARLIDNVAVAG